MSLCAVAIDSKAQPCKISVEVGGGTRQQRAFFTAAKPKRDHCPLPVSPTHTMGSAHPSHRTLKPAELCDDEVKDMTSVSHPSTPPPPPPPPTPVTTRLLPPSDGIQVERVGAQAASTSCGFLSGTLCGTTRDHNVVRLFQRNALLVPQTGTGEAFLWKPQRCGFLPADGRVVVVGGGG